MWVHFMHRRRYAPIAGGTPLLIAANWSRPTGRGALVAADWSQSRTGRGQLVAQDNWSRPTGREIGKFIFRNHTQNFLTFQIFFLHYQFTQITEFKLANSLSVIIIYLLLTHNLEVLGRAQANFQRQRY